MNMPQPNSADMKAHHQWASRPADERFVDLPSMQTVSTFDREHSREVVEANRRIAIDTPNDDHKSLVLVGPSGAPYAPTHWSFGQLAGLAQFSARELRKLPSELAADCLNYCLRKRDIADVGLLIYANGEKVLRAATGPGYGRIWNDDIIAKLIERFGDGITGDWRVPGEFGRPVTVTKENTTLYRSDRDMFVFLANENRAFEIENRRNGEPGLMSRGFFIWNSEVGDQTFGISTFLYDYVCCNRIVWGMNDYKELTIRHTKSAPEKLIQEITPALESYAKGTASNVVAAIEDARKHRMTGEDLDAFLVKRKFTQEAVANLKKIHEVEEGRPIESRWDVITAMTAGARGLDHQNTRVERERAAGDLLKA